MATHRSARNVFLYIHGFLGGEQSFERLPQHLQARFSADQRSKHGGSAFDSLVFPSFTCENSLAEAAISVKDYIYRLADSQPLNVVLIAHSMGGIIAADAAKLICEHVQIGSNDSAIIASHPQLPQNNVNVIGIIAYDSPFFHVNPRLLNTLHRPVFSTIRTISQKPWWVSVTTAVAAVSIGVYAGRELSRYTEFLRPLFKETMEERIARIQQLIDANIDFRCYYPQLSLEPSTQPDVTTFINIPAHLPSSMRALFCPLQTSKRSVLEAHTCMFSATDNALGYAELLEDTEREIAYWSAKHLDLSDTEDELKVSL